MKQKVRSSPARRAMKSLCAALALVLAAMIGITVLFQNLTGTGPFLPGSEVPTLSQLTSGIFSLGSSDYGSHPRIGGRDSQIVNILLIGQDRSEEEEIARSDSMILCTFNKQTQQLTMTSFLRDLYVEIPGYGGNRINAAYAFGGRKLLNKTLAKNFGLHIDGSVEVDFAQFANIVDLLGGVEIELRADEAAHINEKNGSSLTEGLQKLTGEQALTYSRIRKLDADGDFGRTNRQRKVMSVLLDTYKSASLTTILSLMDDILPMISTDMNGLEIVKYALELFPGLSGAEVVSQRIPADGAYENRTIDGMAVLWADMDAARQTLAQTLLGNGF